MTVTAVTGWTRAEHLAALRRDSPFDVLVVGGGVTGAGVALDLADRGLRVALTEQMDFARGTSSRSTKLLHGGIRYLPHFEFGLVAEGLREQKVLVRIADFLFEPLEFVIPIFRQFGLADAPPWASRGWRAPVALKAGLTLYDVLGGWGRPGRRHRWLGTEPLAATMPTLHREGLRGGFVYSDAQTDDARLVITVLKTAVRRYGAVAAGGVRVERIDHGGAGFLAEAEDAASGERFVIEARAVVAATGAFTPPGVDGGPGLRLVRSKGTHLLADLALLGTGERALVLPETDDGRVLYIVPWLGHAMVGTTDTAYVDDPARPAASDDDVDYLIRHVRRYLDVPPFEPVSTFAGLRALADPGAGSTARASREHVVGEPVAGYVQVAGGKLTTYRRIAAEAADRVADHLRLDRRSATDEIPLVGAGGAVPELTRRLQEVGLTAGAAAATIARYGTESEAIARLVEADPRLAAPLGDGRTTLADVTHAVRHEAAASIGDVTLRRTHLAWFTKDHARSDAPAVAAAMAAELGWDAAEVTRRLAEHESELAAEGL